MKPTIKTNQNNLTTGGDFKNVSKFFDGVVSSLYELKLILRYKKDDGSRAAKVITRNWTSKQIINSFSRMKRRNQEGYDIYIRPLDRNFILLDDLQRSVLESLAKIKPCLLMETSPGNFQAWLCFHEVPENRIELTELWRSLAYRYQADLNSAKPDQIGRLPGFLNMKPKYGPEFPFVKLHKYQKRFCTWTFENKQPPPVVTISKIIQKKPGRDRSGFDFAIACSLVEKNWTDDKIKEYILLKSEKAKERGEKYINMTINKARNKVNINFVSDK